MEDWRAKLAALQGSLPPGESEADGAQTSDSEVDTAAEPVQREAVNIVMERKGRGGKTATIIEGFTCSDESLKQLAAHLKQKLGTGGSARGGEILIQGDRRPEVRTLLQALGYKTKG